MNKYVLLLYLVVSLFHLFCCFTGRKKWQGATKPLLMPLLLLFYLVSAEAPAPLMIAGILFGFAGDVFLLFSQKKQFFLAGLVSFLCGHICYTVYLFERTAIPSLWILLLTGIVYAAVGVVAFLSLRKDLGEMLLPASAYLLVILVMAYSGCLYCIGSGGNVSGWITLLGGVFFIASDYILARGNFCKPLPRNDFIVMSTYLAAQLFLSLGMLL